MVRIVILLALFCESYGFASDEFQCAPRWRFSDNMIQVVKYVRTIDGDTFVVDIPGMPEVFGKGISVRIKGIDAPEIHATDRCEELMAMAVSLRLKKLLESANRIDLVDIGRDKYFRLLAKVRINDAIDVGAFFLENKWVTAYDGGKKTKPNWCKSLEQLK